MRIDATRVVAPVVGDAVRITDALPVPEEGLTVSQDSELVAVQVASVSDEVTATVWVAPTAAGVQLVGLRLKVGTPPV
jgi:hypothetical protein